MKKKIIFLVAALLCVMLLFVACKKDKESDEVVHKESDEVMSKEVVLVSDGECVFAVVGDEKQNYMAGFLTGVNKLIGTTPTVYKTLEEVPEGMAAVVVGTPGEYAPEEVVPTVPYFGYVIQSYGGDIYVLAYDHSILSEATGFLCLRFEEFYADNNLKFAADYLQSKETSNAYKAGAAPYLEGGENARIFDCDAEHQMVLLDGVEKAEFEAYITKLGGEGYALHSENDMNGNIFKTYTKGAVMLHTYWVKYSKQVRTIVAKTNLLPITSNTGNNNVTTPSVHQLKVLVPAAKNELDGGLGMIIRLADGRFIIYDGGNNNEANAKEIYDYLKATAPNPNKIVIATWFISHAHTDHFGGLQAFGKKYGNDSTITVESFMYNQCYTKEQTEFIDEKADAQVRAAMENYYPSVPVYKPLTGQKYTFSTTTIEILYTMSDFMPNVITNEADATAENPKKGDGNVQTMVAMVDIVNNADKKDRLFLGGDTTKVACDEMVARYKKYLKCDMVTVPHHGHGSDSKDPIAYARRRNGTKELYQYTNPSIAFWGTGRAKFNERKSNSQANIILVAIIENKRGKNYIAEDATTTTNTIVFN